MGNASLDGINGGAALDKEFPIRPIYPIYPICPICLICPSLCAIVDYELSSVTVFLFSCQLFIVFSDACIDS